MKSTIFKAICLTSVVLILLSAAGVLFALYGQQEEARLSALRSELDYLVKGYDIGRLDYLHQVTPKSERITLIYRDGTVLYDSVANATDMENHIDREEVLEALEGGFGSAVRPSATVGVNSCYVAAIAEDGNILRIAVTERSLIDMINESATVIALVLILCVALAALVAKHLTASIMAPFAGLNLDRPLENDTYDEFDPLLMRLDRQNKRIEEQMGQLKEKQQEFALITDNMEEAFVVFSFEKTVLSANRAAGRLFDRYDLTDLSYLRICKEQTVKELLERTFAGQGGVARLEKKGRIYQVTAYPITGERSFAAVLLAADVTERESAEQMRREFTANVSHELKTPLTTIMGSSEIIAEGIARPEDHGEICRGIRTEAARLLALIEDIIKLSRLDEGQIREGFSEVDLMQLACSVQEALSRKAEKQQITLTVEGEEAVTSGIPATLHEMLFNLCDNAIIYNRPGGWVKILVQRREGQVALLVKDNGIGIEQGEQSRIFERFYRVDKSRSKAVGGTGLGLSIVKHAVMLHGGEITLESAVGKGTTVTVLLPESKKEQAD